MGGGIAGKTQRFQMSYSPYRGLYKALYRRLLLGLLRRILGVQTTAQLKYFCGAANVL